MAEDNSEKVLNKEGIHDESARESEIKTPQPEAFEELGNTPEVIETEVPATEEIQAVPESPVEPTEVPAPAESVKPAELPKAPAPKAIVEKPSVLPAAAVKVLSPEQAKALQQEKMIAIESIKKILDKARVAFLTTVSGKQLLSRPMYMQKREFDGTLWFFAKSDSPKVEDIRRDSRVNVLFTEKEFVSLSGRAEIVESDLKKKLYWGKTLEKYFQTGYNNPNIVLIKIEAISAQLWEKPGSLDSLLNKVDPLSEGDGMIVEF
jgi:general stress protein 26